MAHKVKCLYCDLIFDRDKIPNQKIGRRYAHLECVEKNGLKLAKEEEDKATLIQYIQQLFGYSIIPPLIWRQLKNFTEENGYSYINIYQALKYFFEVKKNDIGNAKGIGIVPYIYDESVQFYRRINDIQAINKDKEITSYIPKDIEVHISPPQRKIRKKRRFTFLEEGE